MTTKEQIKQVLEKWGFPILQENDNSLVFRYQMSYVQANITDGDDTNAIALTLSGIFSADNEEEMILGLRTCNDLNCNLLQVKLYILRFRSHYRSRVFPQDSGRCGISAYGGSSVSDRSQETFSSEIPRNRRGS